MDKKSRITHAASIRKGAYKLGAALGLVGVLLGVWVGWDFRDNWGNQWPLQTLGTAGLFGLPGFVVGSVLGALLGLVPGVRIGARFIARHAIAFVGSLMVLTLFSIVFDVLWAMPTSPSEDTGDLPCCCICWIEIWILFIMFPLSTIAESLLIGRLRWRWWMHVPAMAAVFFVTSVIPMMASLLMFGSNPLDIDRVAFLGLALYFSLWGGVYWSLLRAYDTCLSLVVGESQVVEKPLALD